MRNPLSISSNVPRTLISMSVSSFMVLLCGVALIVSAQQDVRGIRVTEDGRFCSNTEMIESKVSNKAPNLSALKRTEGRWSLVVGVDNYPDDKYFSLELAGGWRPALRCPNSDGARGSSIGRQSGIGRGGPGSWWR